MRNHELGLKAGTARVALAALGLLSISASATLATDSLPRVPSFVDARQLPELPASRDAISAERDAAILRSADEARRRAEEERLKAVEIRRQAEALSQRFAAEIPATAVNSAAPVLGNAVEKGAATQAAARPEARAHPVVTSSIGSQHAPASTAPVSEAALARAHQAELELQEARDALARARAELEDATRKAREAASPRLLAEEGKPAAKGQAAKHTKASPAKPGAPARAVTESERRVADVPQPSARPVATAAPSGSSIQDPTMGRQPSQPAVAANAGENPIAGLISKVFGGGEGNAPPAAAFNQ